MIQQELFTDLISVPGLRNVLLFNKNEEPIMKDIHEDFSLSTIQKKQVLIGLNQFINQIDEDSYRLELRGEYGRFIIRSIGTDMSIACVTDENLNVPLLELALEQYSKTAKKNQDETVSILKDEEFTKTYAK
jgi:predicted regulator of Ras-like GTPase activity (Roadblock/LC7/MglB family)